MSEIDETEYKSFNNMGNTAQIDKNEDDSSERCLRSQMVISYLKQGKDTKSDNINKETENSEIDMKNSYNIKSQIVSEISSDIINPSLFKRVQSNIQNINKPLAKINPEEYKSIQKLPAPVFSELIVIETGKDKQPVEPSKVSISKQKEPESIKIASREVPDFSQIIQISQNQDILIEEPARISTINDFRNEDPVSIYIKPFNLKPIKPSKPKDKCSMAPNFPSLSHLLSSVDSSKARGVFSGESGDIRAANVFSKHHVLRGNPMQLKPLAKLLNDKGVLKHDDEVRLSNTPATVNKLLRQVTKQ